MSQLQLFQDSKVDICPNLELLLKYSAEVGYSILRGQGMQIGQAFWRVLEKQMQTDWLVLWGEFEEKGRMHYIDFVFFNKEYKVVELDGDIFFNDTHMLGWRESDVFDNAMMDRIKRKLKAFVIGRQFQFGLP